MSMKSPLEEVAHEALVRLETFLRKEPIAKTAMTVAMIDGMLTALVIGPRMVMPSEYLPWIWDRKNGKRPPPFDSAEEANDIFSVICAGMQNRIAVGLMDEPPRYRPLFAIDERWSHTDWARGFEIGTEADPDSWDELFEANSGDDDPVDCPSLGPFAVLRKKTVRKALGDQWPLFLEDFEAMIVDVRDFFRQGSPFVPETPQTPFVRSGPKVGRNDPCPCGSGKKYKKCCGDGSATVH